MRPSWPVQAGRSPSGTRSRASAATFRTTSGPTGEASEGIRRIVRPDTLISKRNRRSSGTRSARARLSSLLRRRELAALAKELAARGARGWIVGGAPRDLLLGFEVPDVDVAVEGADPYELARALEARGIGTAVPLSDEAPRVARLAGARELDLAAVEG